MKQYRLVALLALLIITIIGGLFFLKKQMVWPFKSSAQISEEKNEPKAIDQVRIGATWLIGIYPENSTESYTVSFNSSVFEPLVKFNEIGAVEPCLAESWSNPDELTWRFHLSPNAKFSDGTPVTAEDVKFTYDYIKIDKKLQMADLIPTVDKVEIIDSKTIAFKTAVPDPVILNRFATNLLIMSKADVEKNGLKNHLGSGPYKIGETNDKEVKFVRNENYWKEKPKAREITLKLIADETERLKALENNEIDLAIYMTEQKNIDELKTIVLSKELQLLKMSHGNGIIYLSLDTTRAKTPYIDLPQNPLKDIRVRQAIEEGIDVKEIMRSLPSGAKIASQLVPVGVFGYNPEIKRLEYDPEKAKNLLEEAGYKDGFTMTIDYMSVNPNAKTTMDLIAGQLSKIGIIAKLNPIEDMDQFYAKTDERDTTAYRTGYSADSRDAYEVLDLIVHTPSEDHGIYNLGYSNKEVDTLIEQTNKSIDQKYRLKYLQEAMQKSMDDVAVIPLFEEMDIYGYSNNLILKSRTDGMIRLEDIAGK